MDPYIFKLAFIYSQSDEQLRNRLAKHLASLRMQGLIVIWCDQKLKLDDGEQLDPRILESEIILLLVSADFLDSSLCQSDNIRHAIELSQNETHCRVIPCILRPVDWAGSWLGRLQALPKDALAVTSWGDPEAAFADIAMGVRQTVSELQSLSNGAVNPVPSTRKARRGSAFSIGERLHDAFEYGRTNMIPPILDILLSFARIDPPGMKGAIVAHALQFNICAIGQSPEDAVKKLLDMCAQHVSVSQAMDAEVVSMSDRRLLATFFVGNPIGLATGIPANVRIREVFTLQQANGNQDIPFFQNTDEQS